MLINLSNHPYKSWEEKQRQSVEKQFGNVIDFPFPDIDPMADTEKVASLADTCLLQCKLILMESDGHQDAVHITGEPCFTYAFVNLARANGITCVCSTTHRNVTYNDQIKTSVFQFVQLRCYK